MQGFEADAPEPVDESLGGAALSAAGLTQFLRPPSVFDDGDLKPGSRLDDVTIVRFVAEGGMGRVYEGLQGRPCRTVAVKVIRAGVLSPSAAKRFEHEAHILGRLTHPGIARIYSIGMQRLSGCEVPYFVMEYIDDARSLTAYATERDLSTRDRVTLFCEACRAVAHGHQKGVIHRDLKPGNMLVDAHGQPKIIDFGVARSTDGDVALTTMHTDIGQLVGTLAYMSPEQFDGASDDVDFRSDVYSLGVVLYELLAGRPPYDIGKRAIYEAARIVKENEPRSLSTVNPKLRGDINTIVAKCLEKDRERRYSSAAELEADLGRYLRGEQIAASPPRLLDSIIRLARRHRLAAMAAAGIVAALVLAVLGISLFAVRAEHQRQLAETAGQQAAAQARIALEERATAELEKARADAEADTSRRRLYVANLRALNSCLENKNLQMGRRLHAENLAISPGSQPLEMRCLGARLDEALFVIDSQAGLVSSVEYSPDGGFLAATAFVPRHDSDPARSLLLKHPSWRIMRNLASDKPLLFVAGAHQQYEPTDAWDAVWPQLWRARLGLTIDARKSPAGSIQPLAISRDGRHMALHADDNGIRIVDRMSGEEESFLDERRSRLRNVTFSPDGSRLAVLDIDGSLRLWDTVNGRLVDEWADKDSRTAEAMFSPDGSRLAMIAIASRHLCCVCLRDASDGRHLSTFTTPRVKNGSTLPLVVFSPDSASVATTSPEHDVRIWNVTDGRWVTSLHGHTAAIDSVAFSSDGRLIASGAANGLIRVWNRSTFACERQLMGHTDNVLALAFRPDGETLASGSQDGTVRIWSHRVAGSLAVLPDVRGTTAVAFRPDGRQLAVAPRGSGDVELWDPLTVERICTLVGAGGTVEQVAYSPDGTLVAAACEPPEQAGEARVWRTKTGELLSTLRGHEQGAKTVTFSPDGSRLLTTSGDDTVMAWDPLTGQRLMASSSGPHASRAKVDAVFGLDGTRIAYKVPHLLDGTTGGVAMDLPPQGQVACLAASADGRMLATGVAIGTVYLTEFATGKNFATLAGNGSALRTVTFDADGSRVATGSIDGTIRIWDARTGEQVLLIRGHEGAVDGVLFSPDGRRLVTGSADGTVRVWDVDLGQELLQLPGQPDLPSAIALSPDGERLVTAAPDGTVRIWGLSNAEIVRARQAAAMPLKRIVTARP